MKDEAGRAFPAPSAIGRGNQMLHPATQIRKSIAPSRAAINQAPAPHLPDPLHPRLNPPTGPNGVASLPHPPANINTINRLRRIFRISGSFVTFPEFAANLHKAAQECTPATEPVGPPANLSAGHVARTIAPPRASTSLAVNRLLPHQLFRLAPISWASFLSPTFCSVECALLLPLDEFSMVTIPRARRGERFC